MNSKALYFFRNFSYAVTSNLVSLIVSTVVVLIIPKLIGVKEYGYWQLYIFYSSYVGFLHFGWIDGIYLKYGGKEYKDLDKQLFFSQFVMLVLSQITIAIIIFVLSAAYLANENRIFIFQMTAIALVIVNVRFMLLYILQSTNRIKEYAQITMLDRLLYIFLIIGFLGFGIREYKLMIIADLAGKLISLLYAMYCSRDIVFRKISTFYFSFNETIENINTGIKLMFANIASMLIIGTVRFGIERSWNVETFGKMSLTLTISNLMMLFINAVGIIMFPILRRTEEKRLAPIYTSVRNFLMVMLLGALMIYYPLKVILVAWLPQYSESLMYMALVFPMFLYEGRMALLINTYLKTLRKEKLMLKINLLSFILSIVITFFTTQIFKNLDLSVVIIVVLLAFRCILAEILLSKILDISVYKDVALELLLTASFMLTAWFINSWITTLIYAVVYIMYLVIKQKDIKKTVVNLKLLVKA